MTADFESLSKAELDNVLSRYYVELRNKKGEKDKLYRKLRINKEHEPH
jgi:hypothetical protein